jgi:hypothetical protein
MNHHVKTTLHPSINHQHRSVVPALLDRLPHSLGVLFAVVLVEIARLDVGRTARVGIVEQALHTRQDRRHVIGRTPAVLQDVEAQLAGRVDVWVEHLRDELDAGRLVGVLLLEVHDEAEGAVLERCVGGTDDHGVPGGGG